MTERRTADTINDDELDQLYADLDHYEEHVVGDLNEKNISLARRAAAAETTLREVLALFTPLATMRATGAVLSYSADEVIDPYRMTRWLAVLGPEQHQVTVRPVDPEEERAATERARHIAEDHPAKPGPCPACRRADQAGLAPAEQHRDCVKEQP
ncbi:hypothetical protein [Streptomyces sp. NPDC051997]|uniref:hypothetical protein n=1 Tax=Streptomyces sp. NPDC051997 TaxID=3155611 RepID=UPI00343CDB22